MASFDENPIIELGKNPIPGGEPCGVDAADDPQYIEVTADLAGLDRIEADEPDWFKMEQDTINVLRSTSKDVEIAAALGHALFKRYSYAGLSATLALFTKLVNNFWDGLYPSRPRRRKVRMETLTDRFVEHGWFRENQPKPDDFDAIDAAVVRVEELSAALTAKMPDDKPEFDKFIRGLKELAGKRPKTEAPPPPPAAEGAPGATLGAAPTGAPPPAFAAGELADVGGALNAILSASTFLRKADATDPFPYAIVRVLKWSKLALPTSDEAKYRIEPPEASAVDALTHQMANSIWDHLLKNAESAFRSSDPLWLDLQRYVCGAMTGLGSTYDKAREAVMGQTAALVQRLGDGLYELKFRNGTPLCSGETRMWLESDVLPAQGSGGGGGGADTGNGKLAEASDKARKLAGSGKLKEALGELQEGLITCSQRRDRFLWRLRIAQLCYDSQRLQLAAPLLEECFEEIRRYHIDEWEPTLAVDVAQTLYRCRKSLLTADKAAGPDALSGVRESYAWLCQLDPLAALAAEPTGK
ncbi:MAG: type VI secretion system protein TssA [Phycisphaerales bacterium]|nr:MAG: type VI secretion system protein TssA [Phycisphaerales bacterium]